MPCTASFQPLCKCGVGILRIHPDGGDWEERSRYIWCTTMVAKGNTMELWGVDELPPLSHLRAIKRYGVANCFTFVAYERHGEWVVWDLNSRKVQRK